MLRMKITVCQLDPREGQIDTYISSLKEHITSENSEFVLLPEMSFSEWLAADKNPNPDRWEQAIERHNKYINNLNDLGAAAIVGTRPIINSIGSRRNEAYIWTKDLNRQSTIFEKYYLPDEDEYCED